MRLIRHSLMAGFWLAGLAAASAAGHSGTGHAVPMVAPTLFNLGPLPVTNSMINTWIIAAFIFLLVRLGARQLSLVPGRLQNVIETVIEALEDMTEGLLEPKVVRWCFPLVATFFLFILFSNLTDLLPGVGSLGYGLRDEHSALPFALVHADTPWFRPPTADANTTVAMALIFFIMSIYWAIKYNGFWGLLKHIFGLKGGIKGVAAIPLSLIFLFVGIIELISIAIRPVALAMRLYGNIYGGESVLTTMLAMLPFGVAAIPFYFLELIVAVIQALVFTMLCIAFIGTLCSHAEEESIGEAPGSP